VGIQLKTPEEIALIREAGKIVAGTLDLLGRLVAPGIQTAELDEAAEDYIRGRGGVPAFKGYRGFPANICVSVNDEVVHGIPGARRIERGDIVSLDVGVRKDGFYADGAWTFSAGRIPLEARRLLRITRRSLEKGIEMVRPGARLREVSAAIQRMVEGHGFSVVRKFVGHGIGRSMHEEPQVPNFVEPAFPATDIILEVGTVLAIEPMVNAGTYDVFVEKNGWTVRTRDGSLSSHFEHTVAVVEDGSDVLTLP